MGWSYLWGWGGLICGVVLFMGWSYLWGGLITRVVFRLDSTLYMISVNAWRHTFTCLI